MQNLKLLLQRKSIMKYQYNYDECAYNYNQPISITPQAAIIVKGLLAFNNQELMVDSVSKSVKF